MEIIGSIDNAALHNGGESKPLYHLVFTTEMLVMARVMNRRDELKAHPIQGREFGGGMQGSIRGARSLQIWIINEAQKRGAELEKELDTYI